MEPITFLPMPDRSETKKESASPVEVRLLDSEEVKQIVPVYAANGASMPADQNAVHVGAVKDGKVVGFLTLQLCVHAEPMWIEKGNEALLSRIIHTAEDIIIEKAGVTDVYLFAPAGRISQIAQTVGMRIEPWVVMTKRVGLDRAPTQTIPIQKIDEVQAEPVAEIEHESEFITGPEPGWGGDMGGTIQ